MRYINVLVLVELMSLNCLMYLVLYCMLHIIW